MRTFSILFAILVLLQFSALTCSAQQQPQFATVRLVTTWSKTTTLFISKGQQPIEEMELKQRYTDKKQKEDYDGDNKVLNDIFGKLYAEGYKLVSTSSSDQPGGGFVYAGREVIFLLVKE
jgi:hypothetical protein